MAYPVLLLHGLTSQAQLRVVIFKLGMFSGVIMQLKKTTTNR